MKPAGEAILRAARHRRFHWCRRPNGFSDMPIWRVVAANAGLPLYQVVAFANRLEELGNGASNHGEPRGSVTRFSAEEFGTALGMSAEDALRIFAELERPEIGWVAYSHIADFYDRNPDKEDEGAAERKRRQRLRDAIRRQLADLARAGKIDDAERRSLEELLGGTEVELRSLQARLARAELSTGEDVTRDGRDIQKSPGGLSTVTRDGRMSQRDIVTVTPEQTKDSARGTVDNSGAVVSDLGQAELWLATSGKSFVGARLGLAQGPVATKMARWRRELGDDALALVDVIQAAIAATEPGHPAHFEVMIAGQIKRRLEAAARGEQLPLVTMPRLHRSGET